MSIVFSDTYNAAQDLLSRNLTPERAGRVAVVEVGGGALTYAELADRAGRFAALLETSGIELEQRVALCLLDTADFPTCFLGAIQRGAVPVPLSTRLTAKDYAYVLADSRATCLVVSAALLPTVAPILADLPHLRRVFVSRPTATLPNDAWRALGPALDAVAPTDRFADTREGDVALWLYTSGTTGRPKGVLHAQRHLVATADRYAIPTLGLTADDVVFSAAKLFFAYGLGNGLTFPMAVGATSVLLEGAPTPEAVSAVLKQHDPTVFYGVPTLFGMLLAHAELLPARGASRLRVCTSAGEALPPELWRRWHERLGVEILDGLGSTEALHIFLTNRAGEVRLGSSGRPVSGYDLRLVDDDGTPVADGELGHLEVAGPTTAMMYWNQRETTKSTFRGRWMRTGDEYHRDVDGYFVFGGRADDLMKVGGIWVSPFEVESSLLTHDAVLECAVVAHADHDELLKPKAFVVLHEGHAPSEALAEALKQHVRGQLAPYKRPRWVAFLDELPKTATGKIQRYRLRS